jgi:Phosphoesterase family
MAEDLPDVAWIDPNFVDLGGLQGADDDHPSMDVMAGQSFVMNYQALSTSAVWEKTVLVVVYEEHGGFYDHVDPTEGLPESFTRRAEFGHFGPRVPALVVSPFVERGAAFGSKQGDDARFLFDHSALIKTILLRFANGSYEGLPERVASASHLGHLLTARSARKAPEFPNHAVDKVADWWSKQIEERPMYPLATVPALNELGVVEEPSGVQGVLQGVWDAINRLVDRLPLGRRAPPRPVPQKAHAALAEPNELEAGVAAAAGTIRRRGLRPGQP